MENFAYENQTRIVFGKGTEDKVGSLVKEYGSNVLLHYGGGSIKRTGLYDRVVASLKKEGVNYFELGGVMPNPRLGLVKEGIELVKDNRIDFILAVGGGSTIDSAKAIAIGALYEGDVWDFFTRKERVTKTIPVGVVLTIPAAGSESSTSSVITNEDGWYKRSVGHVMMRPKFAIMNPELTFTLSQYQTACGLADMYAHVLERYFTNTLNVDFTDELCEATLRSIIKHGMVVKEKPTDYAARAEIMWEGNIAHNGLLGVGRVEDWASHGIEHEISAIYDVAHGAGLAIVFPAWMKYVYKQDKNRFVRYASKVFGIEVSKDTDKVIHQGIKATEEFFKSLGLPTRLRDIDIPKDRFEEMASKCTEGGSLGSFVKLDREDVLEILNLAY